MSSTASPSFLTALPSHPIFAPPTPLEHDWELVNPTPAHRQSLAIRGFDLIVVVNNELRITSLAEIKDGRAAGAGRAYKTLAVADIGFEIVSIAVNPTGKLLAVIGADQVVVVVLPAPGYGGMAGQKVSCRTIKIISLEHPLGGDASVAKVLWHPWGQSGCSLWVLATDSSLREYCLLANPSTPSQSYSFLASAAASAKRKTGFSARDPRATFASSFAFGTGTEGWGPLMVYGLMGNGDLYVLGPVLPVKASVPVSYLDTLAALVGDKLQALKDASAGERETLEAVTMANRLAAQQKYIDGLMSQATDNSASRTISLSPLTGGKPVLRQGPLLFNPAPRDLDDEDEDALASDLVVSGEEIGIVVIAWGSGRVDIGIELERPEARWESPQDPVASPCSLSIYETVVLPTCENASQQLATIVSDPNYSDTFYVQRASGVHALSIARWAGNLKNAFAAEDSSAALAAFWADGKGSEVAAVISGGSEDETMSGLAIFSDVYLSYGLLGLSSASRLAALELELRFDPAEDTIGAAVAQPDTPPKARSTELGYVSLLSENRFDFDKVLKSGTKPLDARSALADAPKKPLETIDAATLRALGGAIALVQERTHALDAASEQIEQRLDLQIKEVARQLERVTDLIEGLNASTGPGERVDQVLARQLALVSRVDKALQRLMDDQQPILSDVEKRWFQELERLRENVRGAGGISRFKGLVGKTAQLSGQLSALRPVLEALRRRAEREREHAQPETLGKAQLARIESALADEADMISELTSRIQGLDSRLRSE